MKSFVYIIQNKYGKRKPFKSYFPLSVGDLIKIGKDNTEYDGLMVWKIII